MTHKAEQVIDAIVEVLQESAIVPNVFAHRSLSLAEDQGELPAITVNFGDDTVVDEFGNDTDEGDAEIDSMLAVGIVIWLTGPTEPEVKRALMHAREQCHVALLTNPTLGHDFIVVIRYAGASAPVLDSSSETIGGQLSTAFNVHYRMNAANPAL